MEYPKDKCTFCEHTTRNASQVSLEYLNSLKQTAIEHCLDFDLDFKKILSQNWDVFCPLLIEGNKILFWAGRRGKYCEICDCLGNNLLDQAFMCITPPINTIKHVFVCENINHEWGVIDLDNSSHPKIVVSFGHYKHIWGFNSNYSLVLSKELSQTENFRGRGIINSKGDVVVGFEEYIDIFDFYKNVDDYIKVETFDGHTSYLLKSELHLKMT